MNKEHLESLGMKFKNTDGVNERSTTESTHVVVRQADGRIEDPTASEFVTANDAQPPVKYIAGTNYRRMDECEEQIQEIYETLLYQRPLDLAHRRLLLHIAMEGLDIDGTEHRAERVPFETALCLLKQHARLAKNPSPVVTAETLADKLLMVPFNTDYMFQANSMRSTHARLELQTVEGKIQVLPQVPGMVVGLFGQNIAVRQIDIGGHTVTASSHGSYMSPPLYFRYPCPMGSAIAIDLITKADGCGYLAVLPRFFGEEKDVSRETSPLLDRIMKTSFPPIQEFDED